MHKETIKKIEAMEEKLALERQKDRDKHKTVRKSFDELYEILVRETTIPSEAGLTSVSAEAELGGK